MTEQINQRLIWLFMLTSPLLRSLGINTSQLRVILQTKCRLDDRRPMSLKMYRSSGSKTGWIKNAVFLFLGIFIASIFFVANSFLAQAIYLTITMVYAIGVLITDFSNVLIDVRDHYFIVSRPVDDKTVATARMFHILIYLCKLFIPFFLPGVIIIFFKNGIPSGLLFLVEIVSATVLSVFAVYIIYMIMLQLIKPKRFRDVIAYFQIAFSVIIFGGYIIFPQFIAAKALQTINPLDYTISYFFPAVWLAALQNWVTGPLNLTTYIFTALAILVPILCLAVTVNVLSGNFNQKLSMMGSASTDRKAEKKSHSNDTRSISDQLASFFTRSPLEQLGFKITWKLSSRLNQFKSRVYPSFAFIILYFFYLFFINGSDKSFAETWQNLPQTSYYLFLIYAIGYVSIIIIMQIIYSNKYKAAWFYQMSSTQKPGLILAGMIKSIFAKYLLPASILAVIIIFSIWDTVVWLNVVFALINLPLITVIIALIKARKFPFSEEANINQQGGKRFLNGFLILIPVALGFFQSFISSFTYVIVALCIIYAAITWALYRVYKNISWSQLQGE